MAFDEAPPDAPEPKVRLTREELLARIRYAIKQRGLSALARELGVKPSVLWDVSNEHRSLFPGFLAKIGVRRVTTYEPLEQ